jgi:acetyl-CoA C-acetyltransferase
MNDVFILEAVRSPIGRRKGSLMGLHPADLLGAIQKATIDRSGIEPGAVGQIVGGCVGQAGEQAFNIARTAWLTQGLPQETAATTVDSQCGSSQQATSLAAGLVGAGIEDLVLACGVEAMNRVPIGSNMKDGSPLPSSYSDHYQFATQFEGAELIAKRWQITREDTDRYGLRSMTLATEAWNDGRFSREVAPIDAPVLDENGAPTGKTQRVERDEGLRATSLEKLSTLKTTVPDGIHTAGSSSQISDGAACVLLGTEARAKSLGLTPRARILATTLVGVDPYTMLTGPIPASRKVLDQTGLSIQDIDVFEINEAFASVVLAWTKELGPNPERVNPNGGAIAIGHPLGCSGARLITTALHELERTGGRYGLIAMCCGGGLGTGTIIERM